MVDFKVYNPNTKIDLDIVIVQFTEQRGKNHLGIEDRQDQSFKIINNEIINKIIIKNKQKINQKDYLDFQCSSSCSEQLTIRPTKINQIIIYNIDLYNDILKLFKNNIIYYYNIILENKIANIININISIEEYILIENILIRNDMRLYTLINNIKNNICLKNEIVLYINNITTHKTNDTTNILLDKFNNILQNLNNIYINYSKLKNNDIYLDCIINFIKFNNNNPKNILKNIKYNIFKNNILLKHYLKDNSRLFINNDNNIKLKMNNNNNNYNYNNYNSNITKFNVYTILTQDFIISNTDDFFMYNFKRLHNMNKLISNTSLINTDTDIIKILCIKPKLIFNKNCTQLINTFYYEKNGLFIMKDIFYIAFYILYCMLIKDCEYIMKNNINSYNIINLNSPYIHKLTDIGEHLIKENIMQYNYCYNYIEPITFGYYIEFYLNNNTNYKPRNYTINIDVILRKTIETNNSNILLKNLQAKSKNQPLNSYINSYNRLIKYTDGIFSNDFNYYNDYQKEKYNKYTPRVMLTGSAIGCYCLSKNIDEKYFKYSDIDVCCLDVYLLYNIKKNIIKNLKSLNNYNILKYTECLKILLLNKNKMGKSNNTPPHVIDIILSYIINDNNNIEYNIVFPNNFYKIIYNNIKNEQIYTKLLNNIYMKFNIKNNNIKNNINTFLFNNYYNIKNMKLTINNIKYYNKNYNYIKYRDIDIYLSSLAKVSLYHESIVRAIYTSGEFYFFTDYLNSNITKTNLDYKLFAGSKHPIDIMEKKHLCGQTSRILSNELKVLDFINSLSSKYNIKFSEADSLSLFNKLKTCKKNYLIKISIDNIYIIYIDCYYRKIDKTYKSKQKCDPY
tara:strand:- start:1948 stop:4491 length:2544 start_codon:yes stop_codon:yes gene_type:complete